MATGFNVINGRKYYFVDSGYEGYSPAKEGIMLSGFKKINGKRYYFMDRQYEDFSETKKGILLTGFRNINDRTYYLADSRLKGYRETDVGTVVTGWKTIGGKSYHFSSGGAMTKGFLKTADKVYYFGADGARRTGFVTDGGNKYYVPKSGRKVSGWLALSGKKYYLDKNSAVKTKTQIVGRTLYYFGNDGALRKDTERNAEPVLALSGKNRDRAKKIMDIVMEYVEKGKGETDIRDFFTDISHNDYEKLDDAISETLFYGENVSYMNYSFRATGTINIDVDGKFIKEKYNNARALEQELNRAIRASGAGKGLPDSTNVRKINDYICRVFQYDYDVYYGRSGDHSLLECIRLGKGICADYSFFFYRLCTKAGVRCQIESGDAYNSFASGGHAWNRVLINGRWKYIDVTWNDSGSHSRDKYYLSDRLWKNHISDSIQADNRDKVR